MIVVYNKILSLNQGRRVNITKIFNVQSYIMKQLQYIQKHSTSN